MKTETLAEADVWRVLGEGILLPRQRTLIPWHCSEEALYEALPAAALWRSVGGCWPTSRLKILGFSGAWGFNFVSVPGRLSEVQFRNESPKSSTRTYRRSRAALQRVLGRPNGVDHGLLGQQTWDREGVRVENWISRGNTSSGRSGVLIHHLSVHVLH
jgi:hypothetical protein